MKSVGIKVLKNKLSKYLRDVRAGETIWVTDRDEVIAEIHSPTLPVHGRVSRWASWMNAQERKGTLRRASDPSIALAASTDTPASVWPIDLETILRETREDRS